MARYVVTGAFGFSGRYVARRLLDAGHAVHTLTNSPDRAGALRGRVTVSPLRFDRPEELVRALGSADALINTYWVRFDHRRFNHTEAVANTRALFRAAREAGVRRLVHVSITNPALDSDLPYFRGKAELERALVESGLSHAILRPAVLFGREDILVNNIGWVLRRFPVFGIFGDGAYRLRPIHVDDLAALAVDQAQRSANTTIDAVGPESFAFRDLVATVGRAIGKPRPLVSIPPSVGYAAAVAIGAIVRDVVLTRDEIEGLTRGLLWTDAPPAGPTKLSAWASEHAATLGVRYASELARRRDRRRPYAPREGGG